MLRLIIAGSIFLAVITSYGMVFKAGVNYGVKSISEKQLNTVLKNDETKRKTRQKVNALDDSSLVRSYCKWVFDVPYDECVRSYLPID